MTNTRDLLVLGGEKPRNEAWAQAVAESLDPLYDTTNVFRYQHWQNGGTTIYPVEEATLLHDFAIGTGHNYAIMAKSAGCWVTLKAIHDGLIEPDYCVMAGLPVLFSAARDVPIEDWLKDYSIPTLFIQQTEDPAARYEDLRVFLAEREVANHTVVEVPGSDHHYDDVDRLHRNVSAYIAGSLRESYA